VNQAGAGPYSEQVSYQTPATNPDPVSSLCLLDHAPSESADHSPSTCLFLKWEEPSSNGAEITSYVIAVDDQTITVETATSHLVTGLQPDSEYRYAHAHAHTRAYAHARAHAGTHTRTHARTYMHACTRTRARTHTRTHTHTHA